MIPCISSSLPRGAGFATMQVHAGQRVDPTTRARAVPIYASTSYVFDDAQHASDVFALRTEGHMYGRVSNPTVEVFENRMAALEGGTAAVAASSGQAAQAIAILALACSGDNIVASSHMYGGTYNQFEVRFKQFGIDVKFISTVDPADYAAAIDTNTKAVYVESIANPRFVFHAIKELAEVAHNAQIPLIVDNTLGMGGYLIRPIDHGADIVVESATKWIGGHGVALGGVVIDSGKFDWKRSPKFPGLTEPSTGHHNFVWADKFGPTAFAAKVRGDIMRDLGPTLAPFSAFLLLQGLETLSLRAERQCDNAYALAKWLEKHERVSWVSYLGLESHDSHCLAKSYLRKGMYGGVLTFGVRGGAAAADIVIRNMKLASHLANLGDTKTLVIRPSGTTQGQPSEEGKGESGALSDMIRVSLGIETIEDIIADFQVALESID